jgi:hypothetical protein
VGQNRIRLSLLGGLLRDTQNRRGDAGVARILAKTAVNDGKTLGGADAPYLNTDDVERRATQASPLQVARPVQSTNGLSMTLSNVLGFILLTKPGAITLPVAIVAFRGAFSTE